ncbi:FYVE, RhoGEF and PH domain-containing protein 2 [Patella vulgata]|uniref:FYVE, RhoGEF and PH domain-containing protein 2 n=1 Tax=Patella vulgata TaxID=6465 RepID=UPI00217FC5E4|nr:FYVE, RhoGEF and PH domain-containing protein 2 [Patella vulgata]
MHNAKDGVILSTEAAPSKPKFLDRIITGVRQKTKSKHRTDGALDGTGSNCDDVDGARGDSWCSESEVSNSEFFLSAEGSSINLDDVSQICYDSDTETDAYQTATGSLNSPSKSSKVWSTPTSPVISGIVRRRCLDYSKLTESDTSPELVRRGSKYSVKGTVHSTPSSPCGSKSLCSKETETVQRTENWLKNYFSQSRDEKFSTSVMSKGYVRALVEKINDLHHEITPDCNEELLTLCSDERVSDSKETVQTNLSESKSDVNLKSLVVQLNNEQSDKMFKSFHKEKSSSRKNSVDSASAEANKHHHTKKSKPANIDVKHTAPKSVLNRSESLSSQPMSPAELFDNSWSDSDIGSFDSSGDESEIEESIPVPVVEEKLESVCEIKPRDKLQCIAEELYRTEKSYVDRLHLLHQKFYFRVVQANQNQPFMTPDAVNQMFSNVKTIYQFHHDFLLPQLEERMEKWENNPRIGDLMKENAPFLKLYTDYVKNFDNAMNLINYWQEKSTKFSSIIREVQKLPECGNLTLQHHMLGPIQRVPRYELLLKDYIKHLPEGSPDLLDAQVALDLVTKAASHANEAMKKIEKFRKLLEIHQSLRGINIDFISPTRVLIREGLITKIAARSGEKQTRYLFLFNDLLLICSEPMLGAYKVRAQMDIDSMETRDGDNLSIANTFNLMSKQKTIELLDEQTPEDEVNWYESIKQTVIEYKEKKQRIRDKQQSLTNLESGIEGNVGERAPRWIPDESATICMRCDAAFSTFRRRHHCRACGWVICSKCCKKAPLEYLNNKIERVCQKCYNVIVKVNKLDIDQDLSSFKKKGVLQVQARDPCVLATYLHMSADKGKNWMKRWFAAHEDFVLYSFKSDQDTCALTSLPLPGYKAEAVKNIHNRPDVFKLYHKDKKVYLFETESHTDFKKWISVLNKMVNLELPDETQRFSSQSTSSGNSTGSGANSADTTNNNGETSEPELTDENAVQISHKQSVKKGRRSSNC